MKVHVDISIFTTDEAIGMVSGKVELPLVPQIGDAVVFDSDGADLVRHGAALTFNQIKVTNRLITTGAEGTVMLVLDDVTAKTRQDALQIMAFFEDRHGLVGERWNEEGTQTQ